VTSPWDAIPHVIHDSAGADDGHDIRTPNFWYGEAWYLSFAAAGVLFVLAGGVAALPSGPTSRSC
jgi:hypothetical protein